MKAPGAVRLDELLARYYTRYYRDTLGLPNWRQQVAGRATEDDVEAARIPYLETVIGRSFAGLRILNIGCGTGGFNQAAERAGACTAGVDASPEAIEICELRRTLGGGGRYCVGEAEALPFPTDEFDLVYCLSTLEHVDDVARTVREMVRVTRPGGAILLYAPNSWALYENHYKVFWLPRFPRFLARLYLRARGRPTGFLETLNYLSPGSCARLFRAAGAQVGRFGLTSHRGTLTGWLGRLAAAYYRLFRVTPAIQLIARKPAGPRT